MSFIITGIQQIGVGVKDVVKSFEFYRTQLGFDIQVFDEAAEANLMLPYTGGKPHFRRAIFALNINGGGGLEIWQYTSRTPQAPEFTPQLGDLGIFVAKIKAYNLNTLHQKLTQSKLNVSKVYQHPAGFQHFYFQDIFGNYFEVVESDDFFEKDKYPNGGICGAIIGVSDLEKSINFYKNVLGLDKVIYQSEEKEFEDFNFFGEKKTFKRALLTRSKKETAGFAQLLGMPYVELIQWTNGKGRKIFENRYWGDLGFIHLCFDVRNMQALKEHCAKHNAPFTVDSGEKFSMGEAAGHFAYIEDPDGTLIEFVETKKVPILKKLNWYWKFSPEKIHKPVPRWMLKAFKLNRVK
ncbi:MAG TPA: VOC family protein [Bacteroidia bacterium]|nr:VOC family protein [Bacteroidia bacterium]